jgi:Tol biopolymer transport system component/tRNA A-37 threonylcarbamoyl transferase component Bud32
MSLTPGTQLGPYEIVASIGAGGMGEVYKARDTRLDRIVALKVSKDNFSDRFDREARAVAALNHPHICTLHDLGPNYLVMEFIDGVPLQGPLPVSQALKYAIQICDALDAAHRKNIIHRDLKPANVLVTKAGVKVLDFGLAKMGSAVRMDEATLTNALTAKGEILGTLNYMSPEQLQGREAGATSDIFSLGLVLYEMLTGKRAFEGSSPASVIAAILERPAPSIVDVAPPALDRALHRCLEKDPDNRWQTARDLKAELEWISTSPAADVNVKTTPAASPRGKALGWIVAAMLVVALAISVWAPWRSPVPAIPVAFQVGPPEGETFAFGYPVISPNGRILAAITLNAADGQARLIIRHMESTEWQKIPGTEGANVPVWSPDSHFLAFIAGTKIKKVAVTGGPTQTVTDAPGNFIPYMAWSRDGIILFSRRDGLWRTSSSGGGLLQVTSLDASQQEDLHGGPQFLPDGRHFIYFARSEQYGMGVVYAASLDETVKTRTLILNSTMSAVYARGAQGEGYLLFERDGAVLAQPFDAAKVRLTGEPFLVAAEVANAGSAIALSVSETGAMAWSTDLGGGRTTQLAWFDRNGAKLANVGPIHPYNSFALSRNGERLALARSDDRDLWLLDIMSGAFTRFTFDNPSDGHPVWSPDGRQIVYSRSEARIFEKTVDGGRERELTGVEGIPYDWSQDGRSILVSSADRDLWVLSEAKATPIMRTPFIEAHGQFSPDGKWLAFTSDESKRQEIYVQAFPNAGEKFLISTAGGSQPRWRSDGNELFTSLPIAS